MDELKKNTFQFFYTYVFVGIEQRKNQLMLVGGWATPLKNDGVRQLGIWFPIYGKIKAMFQTTNQNGYLSPTFGYSQLCVRLHKPEAALFAEQRPPPTEK